MFTARHRAKAVRPLPSVIPSVTIGKINPRHFQVVTLFALCRGCMRRIGSFTTTCRESRHLVTVAYITVVRRSTPDTGQEVYGATDYPLPSVNCVSNAALPCENWQRYIVCYRSPTSATTAARVASGRLGHAATTAAKSGSERPIRAPTAPDSAPPVSENPVFPADFGGSSSPLSPTLQLILHSCLTSHQQ